MHRQTTTFSSRMNRVFTHRANRVAKAIERQGIRATYELHDRLLSNRSARERFAASPPQLDDAQRGILDEVAAARVRGALVRPALLRADEWQAIAEQRDRFVSATEADLAAGGEHVRVRPGKEFVVRLQSYGVELGPDDPWFRVVSSRRLLDLANTYVGMWSKLEYVDVWYSVPQPEAAERISSQRWHRDYNDKHLLKVFLYLVDVDDSMGPFQFVAGSQPGGPYADAWGWQPLGQNYPTEQELEARDPRLGRADVHRAGGHASLLQYRRLPPRRLLDDEASRARDRDVLLPGVARLPDRAELRVHGRARPARRADAVCVELTDDSDDRSSTRWEHRHEYPPRVRRPDRDEMATTDEPARTALFDCDAHEERDAVRA